MYKPWIRAITAAIAMSVMGVSRWNPSKARFWNRRPFTKLVLHYRQKLNLKDYIEINQLEGQGLHREFARLLVKNQKVNTS